MMFFKEKEINGHAGAIYSCCATSKYIYSASADKYVVRWLIETGEQDKFAIKFEHSIYSIEILDDKYLIAGLSSGDLHIFDLEENKEVKFYQQHTKAIFAITFNSHKNQFYVADADGNLSIWDSNSLELIIYLPLDCGKIRSVTVNDNGEHFALAGQDGYLRIFETSYFNEINTINAHKNGATSVLFHPKNNDLIISGGKDALLKVWNWKEEIELQKIVAHTFAIYDLLSLNEKKTIVSASRDKHIKIWSIDEELLNIKQRLDFKAGGHKHSVNALAKINEQSFVSCSDDKKLVLWKLNSLA